MSALLLLALLAADAPPMLNAQPVDPKTAVPAIRQMQTGEPGAEAVAADEGLKPGDALPNDEGVEPQPAPEPTSVVRDAPRMGRIVGGWEYVWASYGLTWAGMVFFTVSLWVRRPKGTA